MTAVAAKDANWFEMPLAIIRAVLAPKPPKKQTPKPKYCVLGVFSETFEYVVGANGVISILPYGPSVDPYLQDQSPAFWITMDKGTFVILRVTGTYTVVVEESKSFNANKVKGNQTRH